MRATDFEDRLRRGMRCAATETRAMPRLDAVLGRATAEVDGPIERPTVSGSSTRRMVWCAAAAVIAIVVTVALTGRAHAIDQTELAAAAPAQLAARP